MFKIKSISQLDIAPIPRYLLTMEANTIGTWTLTEQPVTTPKWRTRVTWPGSLRTWPPWTTTIRSTSTILRWNGLIHFLIRLSINEVILCGWKFVVWNLNWQKTQTYEDANINFIWKLKLNSFWEMKNTLYNYNNYYIFIDSCISKFLSIPN